MSIICVINVPDGIVMSADCRCTINDGEKFNDEYEKLFLLEFNGHTVGISSCGDANLDGKNYAQYFQDVIQQLKPSYNFLNVAQILQIKLLLRSLNQETYHYVCGYENSRPVIYLVSKFKYDILNDYGIEYKGATETAQCLIDNMYGKMDYSSMRLEEAIEIARVIITLTIACQHVEEKEDQYRTCGGNAKFVVLTKDNSCSWFEDTTPMASF